MFLLIVAPCERLVSLKTYHWDNFQNGKLPLWYQLYYLWYSFFLHGASKFWKLHQLLCICKNKYTKSRHQAFISIDAHLLCYRFQICWTLEWDGGWKNWNWKRWNWIPATTVNSTLAVHAINMLTMCYIPGLLAAYIQLIRGTKYQRFPKWLDKWLRMRKQIGLLMLFSASLHVSKREIK